MIITKKTITILKEVFCFFVKSTESTKLACSRSELSSNLTNSSSRLVFKFSIIIKMKEMLEDTNHDIKTPGLINPETYVSKKSF